MSHKDNLSRQAPNTLVNNNKQEYLDYLSRKNVFRQQENKINNLESQINEMKQLLQKVLNEHTINNH